MLKESALYTFIDDQNDYIIHFLEGQKLVLDFVLRRGHTKEGIDFYRNLLLSTELMTSLLKRGEAIGVYIDSPNPLFNYKIEIDFHGSYRSVLVPSNFSAFSPKITGQLRLVKTYPNKRPYSSIIEINNQTVDELITQVLKKSYQVESYINVSKISDQGVLIIKLPTPPRKEPVNITPREYWFKYQQLFSSIFTAAYNSTELIVERFMNEGMKYLGAKELVFKCGCSEERMRENLMKIQNVSIEEIFGNDDSLEITCDYCNKKYTITKK